MNIVLVEPPSVGDTKNLRILGSMGDYKAEAVWQPLDLLIIAGYLIENGYECDIIDANARGLEWWELKCELAKKEPDLVVFTTSTPTIYEDIRISEITKALTVALGTHVSARPIVTMHAAPFLDAIVMSPEPETTILELVKNGLDMGKTRGLCRRKDRDIFMDEPKEKIKDLDAFGIPAHGLVNEYDYNDPFLKKKPMAVTYGSRGCYWGQCTFCSCPPFFQPLRMRSIKILKEELEWLKFKGIKEIKWFDAELNSDWEWLNKLCRILKDLEFSWSGNIRADRVSAKMFVTMKDSGCHTVNIGVESSDKKILKNIYKGVTTEQMEFAVKTAKKCGLDVVTYCIFGLPGETKETMRATLDFIKELNPDASTFGVATPHPGTRFYDQIEWKIFTQDFSKYNPSLPPVYEYDNLTSDEIFEFSCQAYKEFYMRPKFIVNKLLKTRHWLEIKNGIKTFLKIRGLK